LTDRQTEFSSLDRVCIRYSAVKTKLRYYCKVHTPTRHVCGGQTHYYTRTELWVAHKFRGNF